MLNHLCVKTWPLARLSCAGFTVIAFSDLAILLKLIMQLAYPGWVAVVWSAAPTSQKNPPKKQITTPVNLTNWFHCNLTP